MTLLFRQQWQSSHANLDMSYLALIQLLQKITKCKQNSGSYYTNIFNCVIFCLWINFSHEYCSVTCPKIQKSFSSLKLISLQLRVRNLILFFFFDNFHHQNRSDMQQEQSILGTSFAFCQETEKAICSSAVYSQEYI